MDYSLPGFSVHAISQARILEWVAISFPRGSFWPRNWTQVSCIDRWILYCWATKEANRNESSTGPNSASLLLRISVSSVQSLSRVRLFETPRITAHQASLSITNSRSSLKLTSIELVMPSSHLILCRPLLLLPPIPRSIRVFSNESTLHMRWPKYWSFSLAWVLPKNTQDWSPSEWTSWISLQSKRLSRVFSNTTVQKHQFFGTQLSSQSNSHIHTWLLEKP